MSEIAIAAKAVEAVADKALQGLAERTTELTNAEILQQQGFRLGEVQPNEGALRDVSAHREHEAARELPEVLDREFSPVSPEAEAQTRGVEGPIPDTAPELNEGVIDSHPKLDIEVPPIDSDIMDKAAAKVKDKYGDIDVQSLQDIKERAESDMANEWGDIAADQMDRLYGDKFADVNRNVLSKDFDGNVRKPDHVYSNAKEAFDQTYITLDKDGNITQSNEHIKQGESIGNEDKNGGKLYLVDQLKIGGHGIKQMEAFQVKGVDHSFCSVTKDFYDLPIDKQKELIRNVEAVGGKLKVDLPSKHEQCCDFMKRF